MVFYLSIVFIVLKRKEIRTENKIYRNMKSLEENLNVSSMNMPSQCAVSHQGHLSPESCSAEGLWQTNTLWRWQERPHSLHFQVRMPKNVSAIPAASLHCNFWRICISGACPVRNIPCSFQVWRRLIWAFVSLPCLCQVFVWAPWAMFVYIWSLKPFLKWLLL